MSAEKLRTAIADDMAGQWQAVSMPVKLSLLAPVNGSLSGRATLIRDKQIYISLRMLGIEVAYLYADSDSIYAVDKFHRYYFADETKSLSLRYGVTLANIQDLLTGRPFLLGGSSISKDNIERFEPHDVVYGQQTATLLEPHNPTPLKSMYVATTADDGLPTTLSYAVEVTDSCDLICHYGTPVRTPYGSIPSEATVSLTTPNISPSIRITWSVKQARWNEKASAINFNPPKGYTRIAAEQLLSIFGKK